MTITVQHINYREKHEIQINALGIEDIEVIKLLIRRALNTYDNIPKHIQIFNNQLQTIDTSKIK